MRTIIILAAGRADWPVVLILAGLIALTITLGRLIRRHGPRREAEADGGIPTGRGAAETEARLRETSEALMAEIESLGREVRGQTETRVRVLNELLALADTAISRMEGAEPLPQPPRFEEVYRLADAGLDAASIAERTTFERGEVDLILSLRRRSTDSERTDTGGRRGDAQLNGEER